MTRTGDEEIWIAGAGRFGRRAAETLNRLRPRARLLMVDHDPDQLGRAILADVETATADAVDYLTRHLKPGRPDWIVPCVPFHLVFHWLLARLKTTFVPAPPPEPLAAAMPHPFPVDSGGLAVSYADFVCPPDCPEPKDFCTFTGKPRPGILYQDIQAAAPAGWTAVVVQSRQLAPGLGALRTDDLFQAERRVQNRGGRVLIATACKCHGLVHGLARSDAGPDHD